ncbi:MAG: SGNH/GDSL hydrolase family protein, partial [Bacteroidota bacterium]|nr:SGNH/GDSL hydrolase family protein [Bacteroidota bacterium]
MLKYISALVAPVIIFVILGCADGDDNTSEIEEIPANTSEADYTYLALGDSYTIGESVCSTCKFPIQLKEQIEEQTGSAVETDIIATTGWRTDDLINAINAEKPSENYDFVTLLIGVNNQYQGRSFSQYENEFPQLLMTAINLAKGEKNRVIVVSIPDYAYTPFGQNSGNPEQISEEIDAYNAYAREV